MSHRCRLLSRLLTLPLLLCIAGAETTPSPYLSQAAEVTTYVQDHFYNRKTGLYATASNSPQPDHLWGGGVIFSALVAATRHDPHYRPILHKFFEALNGYWDQQAHPPGYEPSPTSGGGHDKYYDDNAWMVLTFLEAYQLTNEARYLKRAEQTQQFVMSGWDAEAGGGIWWHELHKDDAKNTCVNGPAAVGCFRLSKYLPKEAAKWIAEGQKIVKWTTEKLRAANGLYDDHLKVSTGEVQHGQLSYNTGLMLRAYLTGYACTGDAAYFTTAKEIGTAAAGLISPSTGAYRDPIKWSHLLVEADLELYRYTAEASLLERAQANAAVHYAKWKEAPAPDLLSNASLARELWLLADRETDVGQKFWKEADRLKP